MKHIHTFESFLNENLNESKTIEVNQFRDSSLIRNLARSLKGKKIKVYYGGLSSSRVGFGEYINYGYTNTPKDPNGHVSEISVEVEDVILTDGPTTIIGVDSKGDKWHVNLSQNDKEKYTINLD
jgi:hypothetical protein